MIGYTATTNAMVDRIRVLIPEHPEVMTLKPDEVFKLFKCGLQCDDLEPSLAQATCALIEAQRLGAP